MSFLVNLVSKQMAIPFFPGGSISYQGNPSIFPKRTPWFGLLSREAKREHPDFRGQHGQMGIRMALSPPFCPSACPRVVRKIERSDRDRAKGRGAGHAGRPLRDGQGHLPLGGAERIERLASHRRESREPEGGWTPGEICGCFFLDGIPGLTSGFTRWEEGENREVTGFVEVRFHLFSLSWMGRGGGEVALPLKCNNTNEHPCSKETGQVGSARLQATLATG